MRLNYIFHNINIKNFILKYWKELLIIILTFICIFQCSSNNNLDKKLLNIQKEKLIHESNVRYYSNLNDSLNKKVYKYKDSISKLKEINKKNIKDLIEIRKQKNLKLEKVKNYTSKDVKEYFEDRYNVLNIPLESQGVVLKDSISHLIITDLIKGDSSTAELKITNKLLINEQEQSKQKDLIITDQDKQINNFKLIVSEKDKINELGEKALNNVINDLNKQQKNKNIWKYITISTIITSGILIIK